MIRKRPGDRDPNGASGQGRTDGMDENFSRKYRQDPWATVPAGGNERSFSRNSGSSVGDKWIEKSPQDLLRQGDDFQFRAATRDIFNDVCDNDLPGGGPIKAGVNRSQRDGKVRGRND